MAKPTNRSTLKDYCLRALGFPVIEINVDEDQLEDRIDDAISKFQSYHTDGTNLVYYKHQVTANDVTNQYISCPDSIIGVTRIFALQSDSIYTGSDFNIFDLNYQLRLNELYDFSSADYLYYTMVRSHLRTLEMILVGETPIRFNRRNNKIFIDFNWEKQAAVGKYLVFECYQVLDVDNSTEFWSETWLQRYTTALFKRQWGTNLKKFTGVQLPGGIMMNGQQIYDEAVEEIKELEEDLRDVHEEPPGFLVG